jgi:hypothetical protein
MNLYIGQKISFEVPYFESKFQFDGQIISFKNSYIKVEYENIIDDKRFILQTEITENQIVN